MGRKPVILVGGNMGRNDGVDYCAKLAANFPEVIFVSYEDQPDVLAQHIEEPTRSSAAFPNGCCRAPNGCAGYRRRVRGQTRSARQPSSRAKTSWRRPCRACMWRACPSKRWQ